jgi:hypothetical protein
MPPVGFETTISAGERPKTYALDRAATETGVFVCVLVSNYEIQVRFYLLKQSISLKEFVDSVISLNSIKFCAFTCFASFSEEPLFP